MAYTYESEDRRRVRLLINDVVTTSPETVVFTEAEIDRFLAVEDGDIKLAAAQALDTIADNEALVSKAIATQDLKTDGPKVAEALRKRAAALRAQADDDGYFDVVTMNDPGSTPELTELQVGWPF